MSAAVCGSSFLLYTYVRELPGVVTENLHAQVAGSLRLKWSWTRGWTRAVGKLATPTPEPGPADTKNSQRQHAR